MRTVRGEPLVEQETVAAPGRSPQQGSPATWSGGRFAGCRASRRSVRLHSTRRPGPRGLDGGTSPVRWSIRLVVEECVELTAKESAEVTRFRDPGPTLEVWFAMHQRKPLPWLLATLRSVSPAVDQDLSTSVDIPVIAVKDEVCGGVIGFYLHTSIHRTGGRCMPQHHCELLRLPRAFYGPRLSEGEGLQWHKTPTTTSPNAAAFLGLLLDLTERWRVALGAEFAWVQDEAFSQLQRDESRFGSGVYSHPWVGRLARGTARPASNGAGQEVSDRYVRVR